MRGGARARARGVRAFQIPMRGNELFTEENVTRVLGLFQIPMRGNELRFCAAKGAEQVRFKSP